MIDYADYHYYTDIYKGNLSQTLFNSLINKASREIDKHINKKLTLQDLEKYEEVKYVACSLCDKLNTISNNNVTSISIDGVSKTFKNADEIKKDLQDVLDNLPEDLVRYI
jgi:uncharacterized protein (UPF0276 family)